MSVSCEEATAPAASPDRGGGLEPRAGPHISQTLRARHCERLIRDSTALGPSITAEEYVVRPASAGEERPRRLRGRHRRRHGLLEISGIGGACGIRADRHLSIALGMKAIERGHHVRFTTIQDLAAELRASMTDESTEDVIQDLLDPDLVILDELGFTPLDPMLADAFYRIVASRYERGSLIVTSNKSFESWGEVFPDPVIASAVLDRLVHHAHLIPIVGESFRMKELKASRKGGARACRTFNRL